MRNCDNVSKSHKFEIKESEMIEYKKKSQARRLLTLSVKKGETIRSSYCDLCGCKYQTIAHHVDYGKPLDVIWVCHECHGVVHQKDHALNPRNVEQTHINLSWISQDKVSVTFTLDIENYLALKKLSQKENISISKLLRNCVNEQYPVNSKQLKFLFMEKDEFIKKISQRISLVEYVEKCLHKSKERKIYLIRSFGLFMGRKVEKLCGFFFRNAGNAEGLRLASIDRSSSKEILQNQLQMAKIR